MTTKGMDDFKVEFADQALTAMNDPGCAEAIRDFMARLRQAMADVDTSDPVAVVAAMMAFGCTPVDVEDFPEDEDDDG